MNERSLSRQCAACLGRIGQHAPESMVMVVHRRQVRWFHEACARALWILLIGREPDALTRKADIEIETRQHSWLRPC